MTKIQTFKILEATKTLYKNKNIIQYRAKIQ